MKVLMINDHDPDAVVGGGERYMANLTAALAAAGHEVYWFVLASEGGGEVRSGKRVFEPPPAGRWLAIFRHVVFHRALFRELAAFMAEVEPDVVHLHNNYRYPVSILAACRQRRVVQTVHDYCAIYPTAFCVRPRSCAGRSVLAALRHGCVGWRLLATEGALLYGRRYLDRRFVHRFIAPSRHLAEHLDRAGHQGVRHVANFHLWDAGGRGRPNAPEAEIVLYVGGLAAHKGVGLLLAAFEQLAAKRSNACLWVVGDGPDANLLRSSVPDVLSCRVRFFGQRGADELAALYQRAGVVVIPSLWFENAPLVAIEAAACGRAVIASRVGGVPELVVDGETGLLFERGDIAGLVANLERVLADPGLAARLGAAGKRRTARRHSVAYHMGPLLGVYGEARGIGRLGG